MDYSTVNHSDLSWLLQHKELSKRFAIQVVKFPNEYHLPTAEEVEYIK